ncbi:condensation domain-containing protein [Mucilaginibacter gynuensis]|uniref:Phthiocerol/phthiodiolone dimycocerosyl transferase n=1 Tax=Mucilaginibacter gynuensis TaxID=1302236 RepID=A0ABP8GGE8_9SPHI
MKNQQNRTLGAFEKTFWLLDQIDSKDFVLAAEIDGTEAVQAWRQAIDMVQLRHPNLSVKIVIDQFSRPVLEHVDDMTIPLRVLNVKDDYRWEQEVEKELATRFNTAEGPLLRAVLIQKPETTILVLAAHHAVADGTSISYLFRDILTAVTGRELQPMAPQQSNDETLGLPEDLAIAGSDKTASLQNEFKKVAPKVSSIRLNKEISRRLIEKAREEGTTVHGAICAAVLFATRTKRATWSDRKIELISPICARKPLRLDDNYGLNITTHAVYFEGEQQKTFWEVAREAKAGLAGTDTEQHVKNYINFFRDITFNSADIQKMIDILKNAFNHEIMVTNLGKVKYETNFGKLKLKAVYGPMVRSGKGQEQTIGAISTNDSLSLTNTSDNPIEGLLEAVVQTLTSACAINQELAV